jgi:site-specific DNA-methyltransferase (adenine-specific)
MELDNPQLAFVTDPLVRELLARTLRPAPTTEPWWASGKDGEGSVARLYRGDALELLGRLKPESFELIFADPPYFLSGGGVTCQSGKMVRVDKGAWDVPSTLEEMHAFNVAWLALCRRALTPNGSLWVSGTLHNIFSVGYALQSLGFKVLNDIAWFKVNPPPNLSCRYFTHATETVLWARKDLSARHTFDYEAMKAANGGKQMQSLWSIKPPTTWEKRHGKHPTQKPEALLLRIIEASSRPGERVLDPFCGSGTTGVASLKLGRCFVGIDKEPDYLVLAHQRLHDEARQPNLLFVVPVMDFEPFVSTPPTAWTEVIAAALEALGGEADLQVLTKQEARSPRTRTCPTWPATVRRVVRQSRRFEPVGRARYRLR